MCCTWLAGNTGCNKSPFWHHHTALSDCVFGTKACIGNQKNLLNSNTSSTCSNNIVSFGLLTTEICWWVWGSPANFSGFRVLAALLHGTLVVGISQTLRRWTDGATYIRQGGHHVGHWPTFLVIVMIIIMIIIIIVIISMFVIILIGCDFFLTIDSKNCEAVFIMQV